MVSEPYVSLWLIEQVSFGSITIVQMEARPFSQIVALREAFRNVILVYTLLNVTYPFPVIILLFVSMQIFVLSSEDAPQEPFSYIYGTDGLAAPNA